LKASFLTNEGRPAVLRSQHAPRPQHARRARFAGKQYGQLASKLRFIAAQVDPLTDDLCLHNACLVRRQCRTRSPRRRPIATPIGQPAAALGGHYNLADGATGLYELVRLAQGLRVDRSEGLRCRGPDPARVDELSDPREEAVLGKLRVSAGQGAGVGLPPVLLAAATHLISSRSALIVFSALILAVSGIAARLLSTALRHTDGVVRNP
jgi:hypothetical protein